MSDQTEREARYSEAIREAWERNWPEPVIARADQEQAALVARVRELEAALQQSRDDHQGAVEKLRAVEALADEWDQSELLNGTMRRIASELRTALASPVESDTEGAK